VVKARDKATHWAARITLRRVGSKRIALHQVNSSGFSGAQVEQ